MKPTREQAELILENAFTGGYFDYPVDIDYSGGNKAWIRELIKKAKLLVPYPVKAHYSEVEFCGVEKKIYRTKFVLFSSKGSKREKNLRVKGIMSLFDVNWSTR